ncbi:MAG: phosphoribosylanthranilate isomerase [Myxococcaceae bacterium]
MPRVKVKVCGLTRAEDVQTCVDAGVDAIGFNFWPQSKRYLTLDAAERLAASVPAHLLKVGVFVRAPPAEVRLAVERARLGAVQLHGDEDPQDYVGVGAPLWQVVRISGPESLPGMPSRAASAVLLDAHVEGQGGGGRRFDWALVPWVRAWRLPVWLAGGLTPENVGEAILRAAPDGVDVASGVETAPGIKDAARVRAFMAAVRATESKP